MKRKVRRKGTLGKVPIVNVGKTFNNESVNLSNDLLFSLVVSRKDYCRHILEMILGFPIDRLEVLTQKTITPDMIHKGIRMDVYAKDEANTRYDVEMQTTISPYMGKRMRYYQTRMDHDALDIGEDYEKLPNSYLIFICTKDPFHGNRYRYDFKPMCRDDETASLKTENQWIILNAKGTEGEISQDLKDFLAYLIDTREENAVNSFLKDVQDEIDEIMTGEWRIPVMTYEEKLRRMGEDMRAEIREDYLAKGQELNLIKIICKKLAKSKTIQEIADDVEEDEDTVRGIVSTAEKFAPNYDAEKIYDQLNR